MASMNDELMCWLGADRDGVTVRLHGPEPVKMLNGTTWAYVSQPFAEAVIHAFRNAVVRAEWD